MNRSNDIKEARSKQCKILDQHIKQLIQERSLALSTIQDTENEILEEDKEIKKLKQTMEIRQQTISSLRKLNLDLNRRVSQIYNTITSLEFQIDPETRYIKHTSNAKYLFRIPSHKYLVYLTGNKFEMYDMIK